MTAPFTLQAGARRKRVAAVLSLAMLAACGGSDTPTGPPSPSPSAPAVLGPLPVAVSPVAGALATSDTPTFVVRNASGFDIGQATYFFEIFTAGRGTALASMSVPAGASTTSAAPPGPLSRGMNLAWRATARTPAGATSVSATTAFRLPAVACTQTSDRFAKSVVDVFLPFCATMPNAYNNANEALGPPNAVALGPKDEYTGIVSLGERGYVTVDMQGCAADGAGPDLRIHQAVGSEPVTVYASGMPNGPFILLDYRIPCGLRFPGGGNVNRYCDFDLASGEMTEARYFKVEDGEHYPCAGAGTVTEGADLDAVELLQLRP